MCVCVIPVHWLHLADDSDHGFRAEVLELLKQVSNVGPELEIEVQLQDALHV